MVPNKNQERISLTRTSLECLDLLFIPGGAFRMFKRMGAFEPLKEGIDYLPQDSKFTKSLVFAYPRYMATSIEASKAIVYLGSVGLLFR